MKKTLTLLFLSAAFFAVKAQKTEIFKDMIMFHDPYLLNDKSVLTTEVVTYGKVVEVVLKNKDKGEYYFINLEMKHYDNPLTLLVFKNNVTT